MSTAEVEQHILTLTLMGFVFCGLPSAHREFILPESSMAAEATRYALGMERSRHVPWRLEGAIDTYYLRFAGYKCYPLDMVTVCRFAAPMPHTLARLIDMHKAS